MIYKRYIKRLMDVILSAAALTVLALPLAAVAVLIRIKLGKPVLFKQRRVGKDNREFLMMKFRTMTESRDEHGIYLPDSERITPFGSFLRATSIDELPSLLNILKGEMSIIGPRPLPVRYLERYTTEQLRRHEIRPGLSNVAVINGRNAQTWEEQFEKDVWYVGHVSFWIDFKSILSTIMIVLSRKGATSEDGGSRCEFIGTADIETLQADSDNNYMKLEK